MIAPGNWLSLLGGGQLGRMFCHAAQRLGYRIVVLEPTIDSPAAQVADYHLAAPFDDLSALAELARLCSAVTTEFENVPATTLEYLAQHTRVTPNANNVAVTQNRQQEKTFLQQHRLPHVPYWVISSVTDCSNVPIDSFPAILKSIQFGYDGKGQITVNNASDLEKAWTKLGQQAAILEKKVILDQEISVILARKSNQVGLDPKASYCYFPIAENHHQHGILDLTLAPARISVQMAEEARRLATIIAEAMNYQGVLCVEMFVVAGKLFVNELAPRPHNSGHYTIDACTTSQFDQQVRVLVDAPLGDESETVIQHTPAVMVNLLGDLWFPPNTLGNEQPQEPAWPKILALSQTSLHLYGKKEPRLGRKMGHITCLGPTLDVALRRALQVKSILSIPLQSPMSK